MGISHVLKVNVLKYRKAASAKECYPSDKCLCIFYEASSTMVHCIQECGSGEEITYRIEGQMLLIYDAKAFTEKCTFHLRFSTNAILMLISSSLEFHKLFSIKTSAWLRSLAWIKSSICNQQLNQGFSTVHTGGLILPSCLSRVPGLLELSDQGLNSEQ